MISATWVFSRIKVYLVGAAVVLGAFLAAFLAGRREGRTVAKAEQVDAALQGAQRADQGSAEYRGKGGAESALDRGKF
jgi:hypothetical protein